ncbi:hypothetical protein BDV32DRAFT_146305 [Aspergillus pseudonomiae]|uniref:Uncharacterized protein n=1 Tax=Aspergillus pseudonomiae TaxID=1506151 RepID=A0A5N7DQN3_9EURO|nr:uncharacterized protein BDV37DRAFT_278840 [Aspergillus pseudonomiae]KAB8263487.1 hypothetical protein BDV32DRAFT_146305 [Aspergillus pseudonomiae]KAE8408349.1 hypothetical protein BDV37DRAFT_278840 [Aspergillus pseudonomiae]
MKLSLAVSLTALVAAVVATYIEQDVPQCLVDCIYEVNITRGLDIPSFCDRPDFHVAVGLCMGGNDGKSGKCSEEDQKIVWDFRRSLCDP